MWIADNVYEVKSRAVSMFLYMADDSPICFDTGISEEPIKREFDALGFKPEHVKHVFLTHTDRDHVGGLNLFKNADVYLSIDEEQMVNKTTPRFLGLVHNPPLKKSYTLLKNGDIVQAGQTKIEALTTPGHTPGSMSYLVNDSILFAGDTLRLKDGKVRPFSRLHLGDRIHMDITTQTESVRKLAQLKNISLMVTAHTGFTTDFQSAMSDWV
jgi:glyoxylase-like metal-dependent hydrolase (beta-lactamase superfamily II)